MNSVAKRIVRALKNSVTCERCGVSTRRLTAMTATGGLRVCDRCLRRAFRQEVAR